MKKIICIFEENNDISDLFPCKTTNKQRATKEQVEKNIEIVKEFIKTDWEIWALKDARLRGKGYGWTFEDKIVPYEGDTADINNPEHAICTNIDNTVLSDNEISGNRTQSTRVSKEVVIKGTS